MKRITSALLLLFCITTFAQQGINYKALIKDNLGAVVASQDIDVRFSIIAFDGGGSPILVYSENHTGVLTDANGIAILVIGGGSALTGVFADIAWGSNTYSLKVEIDIERDGTFVDMGTTQFMSVPYALHANNGQSSGMTAGEMQYWNGTAWVTVAPGIQGQILSFINGVPTWTTTVELTDVYNPTTGKIWMDRNLGASQVATSSTDDASYGDLYQWGRGADGHQLRTSTTTTTLSSTNTPGHGDFILAPSSPYDWRSSQNDNLWQGVNGVNNPCPTGYRLPTYAELNAERLSWSSINAAGAYNSPLKLPVAGLRSSSNGDLYDAGSFGRYWSSTVNGVNSRYLFFSSGNAYISNSDRATGYTVRCIKD